MKYLLVVLVVVVVLWLMFGRRPAPRRAPPAGDGAPEGMLACAHCGVHPPRSEALLGEGLPFCSAAHREAGPRPG